MQTQQAKYDSGFITIVVLVVLVTIWLLLTPVLPSCSLATMRRFHLGSGSFARWALQFPIPAMYNFANQYQLRSLPPDLVELLADEKARAGYLNHFPARVVTFADGRYQHLRDGNDRWVTLRSDYRGHFLESHWRLHHEADQFVLQRLATEESLR